MIAYILLHAVYIINIVTYYIRLYEYIISSIIMLSYSILYILSLHTCVYINICITYHIPHIIG